jgi:hypothetical protein
MGDHFMSGGNGGRAERFKHLYTGDCEALERQHESNPLTLYINLLNEGRTKEEAGGIVTIYQDVVYRNMRLILKRPRRLLPESTFL